MRTSRRSALAAVVAAAVLPLTGGLGGSAQAAYPGLDGKIAFVRANQIYTMSATGTGVTKLTSDGKNYRPTWSPDGTRIAYIHETSAGAKDVWVMAAGGATKRNVTRSGDVTSAGVAWSPDGKRLAYGALSLHTIKSTAPFGTAREEIANATFDSHSPVDAGPIYTPSYLEWAPDGSGIVVFNNADSYYDDAMWTYDPVSHDLTLTAFTGSDFGGYEDWRDPFFGPEGTFGYSSRDLGQYGDAVNAPILMAYEGFTSKRGDVGGAPSPSGRYVAFANASTIYRAAADGSGRKALTAGYQPDWQPTS